MISELSKIYKGSKISYPDLHTALMHSDKELFEAFRDGEFTVDQYKCRSLRKALGINYKTLDDIKEIILPEFTEEEALRKIRPTLNMIYGKNFANKEAGTALQPFEINKQCLRSIAKSKEKRRSKSKPDYFFRNRPREDPYKEQNK